MKKVVALVVLAVMCLINVALAENMMLDFVVDYLNKQAATSELIDGCYYSEEADRVIFKLRVDYDADVLNSLDDELYDELCGLYAATDNTLQETLELANCDVSTVTVAHTKDNQMFFIAIDGVDLSEYILEK